MVELKGFAFFYTVIMFQNIFDQLQFTLSLKFDKKFCVLGFQHTNNFVNLTAFYPNKNYYNISITVEAAYCDH
jgi:hypothetical protein